MNLAIEVDPMTLNRNTCNVATSFALHSTLHPDTNFLKITSASGTTTFTFGEMYNLAQAYNAHFRAANLPRGAVLAIVLTHDPELYSAFLGAIMAGLVPTIMPFPTPKQDRVRYWTSHVELFRKSEIRAIFTYENLIGEICTYFDGELDYLACKSNVDLDRRSTEILHNDIAVLQHSSGTTALKKGVMLTHEAIHVQVQNYSRFIGLSRGARIVTWLPLYHDMGFVACFLMPMIVGCAVSHLDAFVWSAKPTILLDEIVEFVGEFVWLPNFAFNHIANSVRPSQHWNLASVKAIINCSEPCKPSTFERFRALPQFEDLHPTALQACYAMAENVFAVTQTDRNTQPRMISISAASLREGREAVLAQGDEDVARSLSCGRPIDGVSVRIVSQDQTEAQRDMTIGEIHISGNSLYSGYYQRPEITSEKLREGWHATGDIGFIYDHELYILGRVDDLLNVRGKNIYAHEVEDLVNSLEIAIPGRVVAFSIPNESLGTSDIVVLCEAAGGVFDSDSKRTIREAVASVFGLALGRLEAVPAGTLVKTTSGKLSRAENRKQFLRSSS